MNGPLYDRPEDNGLPPYEPPAWYTAPLTAGGPDSPVPWHPVGATVEPGPSCHVCQARPAAAVAIRSHTGMIFWGRTRTTQTLWQGWWGLLSLLVHTPLTLAENTCAYRQFKKLPVSTPPPGRVSIALRRTVTRRPQAYVALIPLVWAVVLITQISRG